MSDPQLLRTKNCWSSHCCFSCFECDVSVGMPLHQHINPCLQTDPRFGCMIVCMQIPSSKFSAPVHYLKFSWTYHSSFASGPDLIIFIFHLVLASSGSAFLISSYQNSSSCSVGMASLGSGQVPSCIHALFLFQRRQHQDRFTHTRATINRWF